jgi:hypothetical protein
VVIHLTHLFAVQARCAQVAGAALGPLDRFARNLTKSPGKGRVHSAILRPLSRALRELSLVEEAHA